jgi:hypothetical protein
MRRRNLFAAAIAAVTLFLCSTDATLAQKKKQPQAGRVSFQECCEKAYARFSRIDGRGNCTTSSDAQKDSFYQCVHNNSIRTIDRGQRAG